MSSRMLLTWLCSMLAEAPPLTRWVPHHSAMSFESPDAIGRFLRPQKPWSSADDGPAVDKRNDQAPEICCVDGVHSPIEVEPSPLGPMHGMPLSCQEQAVQGGEDRCRQHGRLPSPCLYELGSNRAASGHGRWARAGGGLAATPGGSNHNSDLAVVDGRFLTRSRMNSASVSNGYRITVPTTT